MRSAWTGPPLIPGKYEVSCVHSSVEAHPVSVSEVTRAPGKAQVKFIIEQLFIHPLISI